MMKVLFLLAILTASAHAWGSWDEGLKVRFDIGLIPGRSFFIKMPMTLREAKNWRWVESTRPAGAPLPGLVLYTPSTNDVVVGALFDSDGDVAGLQIAIPEDNFYNAMLNWAKRGFVKWTAPANSSGKRLTYWVTAQYFVSESTLAMSKEERAATRRGRVLQDSHVYMTGPGGDLLPVPVTATGVANGTPYTRQACVPLMGRHYFYNMSSSTECTSEGLYPWFTLVDGSVDQLIGSGLVMIGQLPARSLVRDYFERPATSAVKTIVSSGPDCLYEMADRYGVVTMHIYYVDSPMLINCIGM